MGRVEEKQMGGRQKGDVKYRVRKVESDNAYKSKSNTEVKMDDWARRLKGSTMNGVAGKWDSRGMNGAE